MALNLENDLKFACGSGSQKVLPLVCYLEMMEGQSCEGDF